MTTTAPVSLAGAQEKTALTKVGRLWRRPHGATPTTHISKLPQSRPGRSARRSGPSARWACPWRTRRWPSRGAEGIARLPQEDFCQALGLSPDQKYEKDGGPGMEACLRLLDGSADAEVDRLSFQLTQLAFWLMAASDGHAKNYLPFLQQGDAYAMTPLYDVISIWPYIGDGANQFRWRSAGLAMAMRAKNAHYTFHSIRTQYWHAGDKERRPAEVPGDARQDRSGRRGAGRRRVATAAVVFRGGTPFRQECGHRCMRLPPA